MKVQSVISLGSNIEPRAPRLAAAVAAIAALPKTRLAKLSTVRDTEPVGVPEEFAHCRFLNQIAVVETELELADFFRRLQQVEKDLGRERGAVRNAPRTIDIDIITFGNERHSSPELEVPHPRARGRNFVLEPLAEVLPGFEWPE